MLKLTIPFTNEIVFNSANYRERQRDEVTVNQFDETRARLDLSVKALLVDDITVFMISLKCPESVLISIEVSNYARIMNFVISGALHIKEIVISNKELTLAGNTYQSLSTKKHQRAELVIQGEVKLFTVCFTPDTVYKLVTAKESAILRTPLLRLITSEMNELIHTIIHGVENNTLHRILLVAKILELLFYDLEQIKTRSMQPAAPLSVRTGDRKKLEAAKKLIGENLQAPCSLIELAHKVGLNDFKLKKGFREVFGTTVFGYLADLRMEKAKKMLATAHYSVSEVAHVVGYKNAHHFTAAFKKKFGQLPSKTRKITDIHIVQPARQ